MSVAGQTGLEGLGFEVVGEVMGCVVQHIGWTGWGGCGYYPGGGGPFGMQQSYAAPNVMSGAGGFAGFAPYVDALYSGYDKALVRMLTECQALGGDGVVGLRFTVRSLGEENREFLCYGTAVRAKSSSRPKNLFSTDLPGQDLAKLLHGGWAAVGYVVGIAIAIRHDDWATRQQASMMGGNAEVSGYTDLVNFVRSDARKQFRSRVVAYGAEGSISSNIDLSIWEREAGENHRDHVALATMSGTAIARFHKSEYAQTDSLKILPLGGPRRRR
jgi:uncharacterized protein YbjQ (UPF0145 family)